MGEKVELARVDVRQIKNLRQAIGTYNSDAGKTFEVHFTTPLSYKSAKNEDAFFILGVLLALTKRENYRHTIAVSQELKKGVEAALAKWLEWYKFLKPIKIDAILVEQENTRSKDDSRYHASFFSGGIDSLFTCTHHEPSLQGLISIAHVSSEPDEILEQFAHLEQLGAYANKTGRQPYKIATNMMTLAPEVLDSWAWLGHGAALAAVAHILSGEIQHAVISSSDHWDALEPWGSHPHTDPLFSSPDVKMSHFGNDYDRVQKTVSVSSDADALGVLAVCHEGRAEEGFENCSKCSKCLRTMISLDLAGVDRSHSTTFDWSAYDTNQIEKHKLHSEEEMVFLNEIIRLCHEKDRPVLAGRIEAMIKNSQRRLAMKRVENFARKRLPYLTHFRRPLIRIRNLTYRAFG